MVEVQIISAVASALTVVILTAVGRAILGIRSDMRRFMNEHMWLLSTSLWTRDQVWQIMRAMDMEPSSHPPSDLPKDKK